MAPGTWPSRVDWRRKNQNLPELIKTVLTITPPKDELHHSNLIYQYSSYDKLLRITAFCMRLIHNIRSPVEQKRLNPLLMSQELSKAEIIFLAQSQCRSFPEEVDCLNKGKDLCRKSTLLQRRPFLDPDGLLRVGGRLRRIELSSEQRHPVILHPTDRLTNLITRQAHSSNMHVGPTGLMGILSIRYHVVGVKALVKSISKDCVTCQRNYARTTDHLMGQLPPCRVKPAPPFSATGADFAGPFTLGKGHTRKPVYIKGYCGDQPH